MRVDKKCWGDKEQGGHTPTQTECCLLHTHGGDRFANKKGHLLSPGSCLPACVFACGCECWNSSPPVATNRLGVICCLVFAEWGFASTCVLCYKNHQSLCCVPQHSCASLAAVHTGTQQLQLFTQQPPSSFLQFLFHFLSSSPPSLSVVHVWHLYHSSKEICVDIKDEIFSMALLFLQQWVTHINKTSHLLYFVLCLLLFLSFLCVHYSVGNPVWPLPAVYCSIKEINKD